VDGNHDVVISGSYVVPLSILNAYNDENLDGREEALTEDYGSEWNNFANGGVYSDDEHDENKHIRPTKVGQNTQDAKEGVNVKSLQPRQASKERLMRVADADGKATSLFIV
jgi:hypothetical protein